MRRGTISDEELEMSQKAGFSDRSANQTDCWENAERGLANDPAYGFSASQELKLLYRDEFVRQIARRIRWFPSPMSNPAIDTAKPCPGMSKIFRTPQRRRITANTEPLQRRRGDRSWAWFPINSLLTISKPANHRLAISTPLR